MAGLVILQPSQEVPLNHTNSRARISHTVTSILEGVAFDILSYNDIMTTGQISGRAHKVGINGTKYVEDTEGLPVDRKMSM